MVVTSTSGGTKADVYAYSPYGESSVTSGVAYRFTGRRFDPETGIYYYRARYYRQGTGQFMSLDPIGKEGGSNLLMLEMIRLTSEIPTGLSQKPSATELAMQQIACLEMLTPCSGHKLELLAVEWSELVSAALSVAVLVERLGAGTGTLVAGPAGTVAGGVWGVAAGVGEGAVAGGITGAVYGGVIAKGLADTIVYMQGMGSAGKNFDQAREEAFKTADMTDLSKNPIL